MNRIIATDLGDEVFSLLTVEDRQRFCLIEDRVSDMFAMLDATLNILTSLQEKYHIFFLDQENVSAAAIRTDTIAYMFLERIKEIEFIQSQLKALDGRVKSSVQLLSSLLDLENGQSLRKLAEESRQENVAMRILSEKASADASAVKVITIITLIYLPTSVVTNFFSTTFVNSQPNGAGTNVTVADNWWVLVAVSIPLTLFTCAVWWLLYYKRELVEVAKSTAANSNAKLQQVIACHSRKKVRKDEEDEVAG